MSKHWVGAWIERNTPDRESLARNRWMRPFAARVLRSDLWRFTRRSVPRGTALGLLVGIFLLIPGLQIVGAALLALPFRANIPVAAAMTFLSNPLTTPFILLASLNLGNWLGFRADLTAFNQLRTGGAGLGEWTRWLLSDAAPAVLTGLALIAIGAAVIGYFAAILVWRVWTSRKWRSRRNGR